MTALGDRIAALIRAGGPITVADYMALCLGDPEHGYYMTSEPFGRGGDFVTAPEISQVFGELIGLWGVATWEAMGAPPSFVLTELGPGRGTLMADLLRAARVRPAFLAAAGVHLVETSPRLRALQEAALKGVPVTWHATVDTLPRGPLVAVANEFFDALPIRQYVRTGESWGERMVGLDEAGRLIFGLRPLPAEPAFPLPGGERDKVRGPQGSPQGSPGGVPGLSPLDAAAPSPSFRRKPESITHDAPAPGRNPPPRGSRWTPAFAGETETGEGASAAPSILEVSPASTAIMAALAARIAAEGGAALVVDYGYEGPASGDTLQAVRGHAHADPLAEPGAADLTAHVDFAALARAAAGAGARPRALVTQSVLLQRLGIAARAERLSAGKDAAAGAGIAAAVHRLVAPEAMGELFKVLAVSHSGLALPAFDDDVGAVRGRG